MFLFFIFWKKNFSNYEIKSLKLFEHRLQRIVNPTKQANRHAEYLVLQTGLLFLQMLQLSPFDYLAYIQFVFAYCVPSLSPRLYCTVYLFFRQLQLTDELKFEKKEKRKWGGGRQQSTIVSTLALKMLIKPI